MVTEWKYYFHSYRNLKYIYIYKRIIIIFLSLPNFDVEDAVYGMFVLLYIELSNPKECT